MIFFFLVSALLFSYFLTPIAGRIACRFGAVDYPGRRKVHEGIIPRFGGVAIFAAFVLATAGFLIFALGVYDDLRGTNAWVKISVQLVAAFLRAQGQPQYLEDITAAEDDEGEVGSWGFRVGMLMERS